MNSADLSKILEEHKVWITSMRESGSRANLRGANLYGADLCDANLRGADLCDANLYGADLPDLTFVILGEKYFISITNGEYVRAGCQNHTVEEWRKYSKQEIDIEEDLGISDDEWDSYSEEAKDEIMRDVAWEKMDWGFEEIESE
ncbi:hypothetical protein GI099_05455 [Salmonella enterica]|nr:hypothetical protein [Salmonella enterica]